MSDKESENSSSELPASISIDTISENCSHDTKKVKSETNNSNNNGNSSSIQIDEPTGTRETRPSIRTLCMVLLAIVVSIVAIAVVVFIWYNMGYLYGLAALWGAVLAMLLVKPGWRWFYIGVVTSKRDTTALIAYIKLLMYVKKLQKKNLTIGDVFESNVAMYPDKIAIVSELQSWTFRQLNEFSNRLANVFVSHGYKKGDVVGLLMENRAEFVGTWLGLSKIGIVTPLINTNLRGPSLLHSITVGQCTALIYGESFESTVLDIIEDLPSNLALYRLNELSSSQQEFSSVNNLTKLLETSPKDKVSTTASRPDHHDKLVYIYTSGTTGLPKAAVITHSRFFFIAAGINFALGFKKKDIYYTPLPLYHTAGGVMSMGQTLLFGSTIAIRKKFSASGYFSDCAKFNCTIAQYIGEMARYILATKPSEYDQKHSVRMIFGNGLRPQIWPQFVKRFNIGKVGEFYGATEGNANIMNNDNTVGAIGFVSRVLPQVYPICIIRADPISGEPIRDERGFCQICKPNESGVFIGKIIDGNPAREFLGYVDSTASSKKIVHNVFKKGDMAFISGDLLTSDERGYLYFKDRTGDTFRWKGENVSTSEVEALVSNITGYKDAVVYGVPIPNMEGRAGMAAIYDPEREIDINLFAKNLIKVLPSYARPQFLRFLTKVDLTGTFKLRKVELQKQAFNPNNISDDIFYYISSNETYEKLSPVIYNKICKGEVRF